MHDGYRNTGLRPNVPVYGSKSDGLWGEMSLFMGNGIYNNQLVKRLLFFKCKAKHVNKLVRKNNKKSEISIGNQPGSSIFPAGRGSGGWPGRQREAGVVGSRKSARERASRRKQVRPT